jgi:hypothetical protein
MGNLNLTVTHVGTSKIEDCDRARAAVVLLAAMQSASIAVAPRKYVNTKTCAVLVVFFSCCWATQSVAVFAACTLLLATAVVLKQWHQDLKHAAQIGALKLLRYGLACSRAVDPNVQISLQRQDEASWPTLVLEDLRASEWLRQLVNRYMHGPIPTKVESCTIQRLSLDLQYLRGHRSISATLTGLVCVGRRTHEDEWDEARFYDKVVNNRRWAVDFAQGLVERSERARQRTVRGSSPGQPQIRFNKWWAWLADAFVRNLSFDARDVHLR